MRILVLQPEFDHQVKKSNKVSNYYSDYVIFYLSKYVSFVLNYDYRTKYKKLGIRDLEYDIIKTLQDKNIDIIIIMPSDLCFWSIDFVKKLQKDYFIVLWTFDDEVLFEIENKYLAVYSDYIITTSNIFKKHYESFGKDVYVFHSAYDINEYAPKNIIKDIDVSFVGIATKNDRMDFIKAIESEGLNIETFGKNSKNGYLNSIEDMIAVFNRTKINLNFTKCVDSKHLLELDPFIPLRRQAKGRVIELSLSKSFCLSEYAPELDNMFEIGTGKEIDIFYNKKDMIEKIKFYLNNDDIREKMAENAYNKAVELYNIDKHMQCIVKNISILKKNKKVNTSSLPKNIFESYNRLHSAMFTINAVLFFKNKKFKLFFKELSYLFKIRKVNLRYIKIEFKRRLIFFIKG